MNLKHLSGETLHAETHRIHREHQCLLTQLLHHLRENEKRRLFSAYKYPSLHAYVAGELKYSEDEAGRRISAMRLLRDVPEIEQKIATGELSMTNMVMAQALFSKERKAGRAMTRENKIEVLSKLENQSVRSAQKVLAEINPEMKSKREMSFDNIEDDVLRERLLKLKGQMAAESLNQLLHKLCDLGEETMKPKEPKRKSVAVTKASIRREVWKRDAASCTQCGSTDQVQEDHRIPKAVGGGYSPENIRLLCRSCNQRAAIEFYGQHKMDRFLKPNGNGRRDRLE